jgi:ABC-type transport system involved in cytochrome c biogenesis permease subunit
LLEPESLMSKITTPAAFGPAATTGSQEAPPRPRTRSAWHTVRQFLAPLASLRVTVVLFVLALFLIFAGTLAQKHLGIWTAIKTYFRWWYVWIPCKIFFTTNYLKTHHVGGAFPFPGGWTIGWALMINLLAAHLVRFRLTWRRSGILILHAGVVLLMVGEWVTGNYAVENNMRIDEGAATNLVEDNRHAELAVVSSIDDKTDDVVVVPGRLLRSGKRVTNPDLPFDVQLERWMVHSAILDEVPGANPATKGLGLKMTASERPEVAGTDTNQTADVPSAYVTLYKKGTDESLGTWLFSVWLTGDQKLTIDGKTYDLALRFKRTYKPYSVYLKKFTHEYYDGTDIPKNFAALVRIHDPAESGVREVLIWMNHPFFYKGDAFYQASFEDGAMGTSTTLQVVKNPAWYFPYIACIMVAAGMLIHFGFSVDSFLRKKLAAAATPAAPLANGSADTPRPAVLAPVRGGDGIVTANQAKHTPRKGTPHSHKASRRPAPPPVETAAASGRDISRFAPWVVLGLATLWLMIAMAPPSTPPNRMQIEEFAGLPVQHGGRLQPVDTMSRTSLYAISARETVYDKNGNATPAIKWLLDTMTSYYFGNRTSGTEKVIRIDNEQVLSFLKLEPRFGFRYSLSELGGKIGQLQMESDRITAREKAAREGGPAYERDLFDTGIMQLAEKIHIILRLVELRTVDMIPPEGTNTKWRSWANVLPDLKRTDHPDPTVVAFGTILKAYAEGDAREFNEAVATYKGLVKPALTEKGQSVGFELFFNDFNPFLHCQIFYILAFLMGCVSWMVWSKPLGRAAFWLTVLTLVVHTWAILARMYIQGRPPVTNLYSTAIFIGWVCAVVCLAMEAIFRNGVGTVVAAFAAGATTYLSQYLISGDTLEMMRAVLDTNVWLATHVTSVTIGYAGTIIAGCLGVSYILCAYLKGYFGVDIPGPSFKVLSTMIYGVVCFAMLFSFTGTVLGGIWADQSWGRFWGWDPKENGAVLIVIWTALILHARWGGFARERGIAILSVMGICVTLWSYFGTNMLGVGLHSYASAEGTLTLALWEAGLFATALSGLFIPPREKLLLD